jgi:hypothetical protein
MTMQADIALSENLVHHNRSKHFVLRHHFLREQVTEGMCQVLVVLRRLSSFRTTRYPR